MTHRSDDKFNRCIFLSIVMPYSMKTVLFIAVCCLQVHNAMLPSESLLEICCLWSYSEDEGSRFLWHIITVLWGYTLSFPRRQHYSWWLQWDLQISHILCSMQ